MDLTHGHLLGGRIPYAQPRTGYRTGIEPILLAASIPAQPGQRVLEAGTGAGAGLLCLHARIPGLAGFGIELDPDMADLARANLRHTPFDIVTADLAAWSGPPPDHAFANPPWHDPAGTPSHDPRRRLAKHGDPTAWIAPLATARATLTLIIPAAAADPVAAALAAHGFPQRRTLRLLPREGRPPKLVIVQGRRCGGPPETHDLVLHRPQNDASTSSYTETADAVLRGGAPTPLATISAT